MDEISLKLYFIPYLASGHMIPLCDIARFFASRGHHVTVLTTPFNAQTLNKSNPFPCHFIFHTFPFPSQQVGLPKGVENLSAVTNFDGTRSINKAIILLQPLIQNFVEHDPPDCIIADFMFPWVHDLANKLCIPRLSFNPFPLFTTCAIESFKSRPMDVSGSHVISDLPHTITLRATPPKDSRLFLEPLLEIEVKSHGLIVNNFMELDGEEYVHHYKKVTGHKAWHLGPASLSRTSAKEKAERGQSVVRVEECLTWLNSKKDNSVVYISFGTFCYFPDKQLYEIARGIEASGHEFIWVVPEKRGKEEETEEEKEEWLPKGFEERNQKKGMIIRGWAPQVVILGHPAVGAFVTHCGWNSTVEAASAGVPMITWPVHGDQFYNEALITQVRGIGVEVGAQSWLLTAFRETGVTVGGDAIEKAVRRLMDGGDEAKRIRERAQQYSKMAREAVEEGGSSHTNLTTLIDDLKRIRESKE